MPLLEPFYKALQHRPVRHFPNTKRVSKSREHLFGVIDLGQQNNKNSVSKEFMLFLYRLHSQASFAHASGPNQRKQAHILSMQHLPDGHQFAFSTNQRSRFYAKFLHDRFIALYQRFVLARSAFALALQNTIIIEDKVSWFQMISKRSVCPDLERSP